jgi:hypothetical protein
VTAFDHLLAALDTYGCKVTGAGRQRMAQCPAHEDRTPSLSLTASESRVLVMCQGGCATDDVLAALQLTRADLFDEPLAPASARREVGAYDYTDEDGHLLYQVVRFEPKTFRQRRPEGAGWTWSLNGTRRVPYRLPAVLTAAKAGERVYVVEGEKDVHAVEAAGAVATCNPGGAGKWRDDYTSALTGADVVIVADCDEPGRKHAAAVRASLTRDGIPAQLVEPASGKDVADHLAAGLGLDDLAPVLDDEEPNRYQQLRAALLDDDGLRNIPPPTPLVAGTIYRDSLTWLQGKPGHAKSFAAVDITCCVASGQDWHERPVHQGVVLYLIAEGASGLGPRVDAWKAAHGVQHLEDAWFLPVAVQFLNDVDLAALRRLVHELQPVLVVIDTQARVTVGAEENSSRDMGIFVEAADVIRQASRACVLVVHHEGRAGEHMRGSTALEGAATTIVRASKDGPMVYLSCKKQKDEEEFPEIPLRLFRLGESAILSHEGLGLGHVVTESETQLIDTLRDHFGTEGAGTTKLLAASGVAKTSFYRALKVLVTRDVVRNVGSTPRPVYVLTADLQQQEVPDGSN